LLRFAPSPTSDIDIGTLRVALFNYILSKRMGEDLLIRIEDIDKEKSIEGKDKEILEILNLFSIEYSGVVYESENLKYHQKLAMQLMGQKKAFACFCSDEKIEELKKSSKKENKSFNYDGFCEKLSDETVLNCNAPFKVRVTKPNSIISFKDKLQGDFSFKPEQIDYFVILKQDKTPTYNYACAIDDMLYDISTIIRDEKYIEDTPKQIYLRNLLSYDKEIDYIHLPSIIDKNNNLFLVKNLIDEGYLPSAIANYLVLLGNETPKEIFTLEEATEWLDINKISKSSVVFDIEKLKDINKKYLEVIDEMRFSKILGFADTDIGKLAKLYLEEESTIKGIKSKIDSIFTIKTSYKVFENEFKKIKECIQNAPFFNQFSELEEYIINKTGLKDESLSKPLRYILTGEDNGPNLCDIYPLIKNYLGEIIK